MNQQNYRNGCRVVTLVICDSKRPPRAVLNTFDVNRADIYIKSDARMNTVNMYLLSRR